MVLVTTLKKCSKRWLLLVRRVVISGSGNVAQYALQKLLNLVQLSSLSDSNGYVIDENGIDSFDLLTDVKEKTSCSFD